jgi:hypothetical protein
MRLYFYNMPLNNSLRVFLPAFTLFFFHANVFAQIDYKGFPQWSKHSKDSTEYFLYTPSNMKAGEKYPVALFMHGCCGTDYHASLRNCVDPPVRMWHNFGANTQVVPTYIISPATSRGWQQHFTNLKAVIDDLIANHHGDPQRVYVCGFSMGGEGTVKILQQYPGFFAAAIPMGMSFSGDSTLLKDIPIWTAQGETDWWARNLRKNVADIRHLNGYAADTGDVWVTGVNPRYSNFRGVGHGVQWDAASTLPLTTWAYSKINDGNKYPQVFFASPGYRQLAEAGKRVAIDIQASDADGAIAKVEVFVNNKLFKTLTGPPFKTEIIPVPGDNIIEALAYDNKGKSAAATTVVKVDNSPVFLTRELAWVKVSEWYEQTLKATGNGAIHFRLTGRLPPGLRFFEDGYICGIPLQNGQFSVDVFAFDEDGDSTYKSFVFTVGGKPARNILITNAVNKKGVACEISTVRMGETPNFNSKNVSTATYREEINFSDVGRYAGCLLIKTDINDTAETAAHYLSIDVESNSAVIVYVAYEKFDHLLQSTIPAWLKEWKKEEGQIVAQYRYFDVYSRIFPKGKLVLPGADAGKNGVVSNYFVMVTKAL